jgi:3-oxoadipate enol-lactonase
MWYHQVPVMSRSYRVITYDLRGHGETESSEGKYAMPLFIEDIYRLMKAIGTEEACFLGYSMGGGIALGLARKYPEIVRALVLANTPVGSPPSPFFLERQRSNAELLSKGDLKTMAEDMTRDSFSPGYRDKNPSEFERYMKVKLQNKAKGLAGLTLSSSAPGGTPDSSTLQCPVLIIVGANDVYMNVERMKQAQEMIAGARLVVLPTGHASPIESPDKFNSAVLEFLSSLKNT